MKTSEDTMTTDYKLAAWPSASLDVKKHNRNRGCGKWTLKGSVEVEGRQFKRYLRLGCKSWSCGRCGPRKAKRLRKAITERATEKGLSRFLTLTLDPADCTPEESVRYIRSCWNKFRVYLKRRYRTRLSYIVVLELQKSGYAHLHILIDRFIEQGWISDAWQSLGGGRIVHIKQVDIHRVAPYLSKYLTKDLLLGGCQSRSRRCTTSRDIVLYPQRPSGTWSLVKLSISALHAKDNLQSVREVRDEEGELTMFDISLDPSL
jgi:hypothetical protein